MRSLITLNRRKRLPMGRQGSNTARCGAITVFLCVCLVAFLIFTAFSINVARIQLSKAEMRSAVDSASRAGCIELGESNDPNSAQSAAVAACVRNKVSGDGQQLSSQDIEVGHAQVGSNGRYFFTSGSQPFNSVRVTGSRKAGSGIEVVFGGLLGLAKYGVEEVSTSVRADRDISVVIDRSGSMMRLLDQEFAYPPFHGPTTPPDPNLSRWAKMLSAYSLFLNILDSTPSSERIGLVSYGDWASTDVGLTDDYQSCYNNLVGRSYNPIVGMTNLGDGLEEALKQVYYDPNVRPYSAKTIVLLTDGRPNVGADPLSVANECKQANVTVHTITFGSYCDTATMQGIADTTGGKFYAAPDDATLKAAFEDIAKNVPILIVE